MPPSFALIARGLTRSFGPEVVLDGVEVTVGPRSRIGVVGPNGVGKSTLLRLLAGADQPDAGRVTRTPPELLVGLLHQEPERRPDENVDAFLRRRTGVTGVEAELERASRALAGDSPAPDDRSPDDRYADALDAYLASGAPDLDARVGAVLVEVGLGPDVIHTPMAALSGGQAARASLAALLLSRFDVFLLDEPTNDLDFDGLARLEAFLDDLPGGVVVVSHDRAFLERTVTSVLEIDEHARTSTEHRGGWLAYLESRATMRRHAEEDHATYVAQRSRLEDRARTQRQWADRGARKAVRKPADGDKNIRHRNVASSEKQAAKARATEQAMNRLDAVDKPWEGWDLRLSFATAARSGDLVAQLVGAVVALGDFRLGPVDLEVRWAERIAIVGANGAGKTTLLRALLGQVPLIEGHRRLGPGVALGELAQLRMADAEMSLLDGFLADTGLPTAEARSLLAKFGLGTDHVRRASGTLSPGERTRAVLARFAAVGVNCLVLDEPTNHLDLPAIEQLEAALDAFDATVLLVSHDRRLLDAFRATRVLAVTDGQVTDLDPAATVPGWAG